MDGGIGSSHHQQQDHVLVEGDYMYRELWKACADPMMDLPKLGERVYYFPMTHMELLKESADQIVPSFDLPTNILCRVINIQLRRVQAATLQLGQLTCAVSSGNGSYMFPLLFL
uniref:Auxin response factor 23 n=1 Tax=Nicotiana tabacum TaxID=4097 RepID=A0A1S3Z5K9_TOBAC|nr:PREDICTED: putative auxin response factor 23 [Nicotiana tabacum]